MSTIKDVAKAAGVSVATVSRAFDENATMVSLKTRERIYACAKQLQYKPNLFARGLKRAQTGMIGFIVPSLENTFYHTVLRHIEATLHKHGFRLLVSFLNETNDFSAAVSDMGAAQVDAVLLCALNRNDESSIHQLAQSTHIIQLFNAAYPEYDSIVMDDGKGATIATQYLLSNGHRSILYIGGDERIQNFKQAYADAGLPAPDQRLLIHSFSADSHTILQVLQDTHPTAAIGISRQGFHLLQAVQQAQYRIPDELSLVVYDDSEWAELLNISAICHPHEQIALHVAERLTYLLRESNNEQPIIHEVLSPYLTERGSVKKIN